MSARTGGLGASLKLAFARVRRHPARALGPLSGIALVAAFAGGVVTEGTVAGEQASRAVLRDLSPLERTVRVTWQGVVTPSVDLHARQLLASLGLESTTTVTLLNPVRLDGVLVRPAAISPLAPSLAGAARALGPCRTNRCPMLVANAAGARRPLPAGRTLSTAGVRLSVSGQTALRSAAPLGFVPQGPSALPVLLTGDQQGLASVAGLSGIFRTHTWFAPLPVGRLHSWQLAAFAGRLQRAQQALLSHGSAFILTAPFAGLNAARAQAQAAPHRLLLAGGGALAALLLFIVLIVGGLRAETDAELARLETAGARATQRAAFVAIESALMCGAALLIGGALAVAASAVLAAAASEPVGGVLTQTIVTPGGALALIGAWIAATAFISALLLIRPGTAVANTAAIAAVSALAVGLAETGGGGGTLSVLLAPLCSVAAGVIVFRCAGAMLRGAERVARNGPLPVRLAFVGLARSPSLPSLAIAFLSVAVGLGGFALCYRATLLRGTSDQAANAVPLDAIVSSGADFQTPLQVAPLSRWNAIARGRAWPVQRTDAGFVSGSGTVIVPALGVPAGALPTLHGWRSSDGSAPLGVLARRLRPPGPVRTPEPVIPATARTIALSVGAGSGSAVVGVDLREPSGGIVRLSLGQTGGTAARETLHAQLPDRAAGSWTLDAVELREPAGLEATSGHQNAENPAAPPRTSEAISLTSLRAFDAAGRTVAQAPVGEWRALGGAAASRARAGGPLRVRFSDSGSVGLVRPPQPSDVRPVPILTDPRTAAAAGPGGSLSLTVDGQPVSGRVVGILKRLPTVPSGSAGFIVADQATLGAAIDAQLPGQGAANELWISTDVPARLQTALRHGRFSQLGATYRDSVERGLRTAPIARAVLGTMIAAAAMSAILAIVGLLFVTLGAARTRSAERDLVAQGLGPIGLRRELRVRVSVAGTAGVLAGLLIALLLARLAVAAVRAAGTIAAPQPPLITVTPALQLAVWTLGGIVVLATAAFVATLAAGRRP